MKHHLRRHFFDQSAGATALEYAMVAAMISITIIFGAGALGAALSGKFQAVGASVAAVLPS